MYKYEVHLHTSACSACARATGEELVLAAKQNGYAGIVITNHFFHGNTAVDRSLSWKDFVSAYRQDYQKTKAFAKQYDIDVLFGIEEGYGAGKEILIYGVSPKALAETPQFKDMSLPEISEFVHNNSGILAFAHPFRKRSYILDGSTPPDLKYADAIEAYNKGNTDEDNKTAFEFARENNFRIISGGDVHSVAGFGKSGLAFKKRIKTSKSFVNAILKNEYEIITE